MSTGPPELFDLIFGELIYFPQNQTNKPVRTALMCVDRGVAHTVECLSPSRHSTTTTSYDDAEHSDVDENFDDETDESSLHLIVSESVDSDDNEDSKQGLPPSEESDGDDDEDSERGRSRRISGRRRRIQQNNGLGRIFPDGSALHACKEPAVLRKAQASKRIYCARSPEQKLLKCILVH